MKKILIVCNANPDTNPRPNRMVSWLKDHYQVTVVGRNEVKIEGVHSIGFYSSAGQKRLFADTQERLRTNSAGHFVVMAGRKVMRWLTSLFLLPKSVTRLARLVFRQYENIVSSQLGYTKTVQTQLAAQDYDLVISHDVSLMPLVRSITQGKATKVMLDAREYYPKNFDDQWQWRMTVKPVNTYLCRTYLPSCDKMITVSKGLAQEYKREFGVDSEVVMSLPDYRELSPSCVDPGKIRIIYHGLANASRRTDIMIEMMDHVDERFSLDLMLVEKSDDYYRKIASMAKRRKNVRIISPVHMREIVPFTNQYDIGLILYPPVNFNVTHALPNKLFEFIQARLVVAIGPSIDMKEVVEQYGCGIVSHDFEPHSLAKELNNLTAEKIMEFKQKSDVAAKYLNADTNRKKILDMVQDLLK